MTPKIKWSTGRNEDWGVREAQAEMAIRSGRRPGDWNLEDRFREHESQTDMPGENKNAASD